MQIRLKDKNIYANHQNKGGTCFGVMTSIFSEK